MYGDIKAVLILSRNESAHLKYFFFKLLSPAELSAELGLVYESLVYCAGEDPPYFCSIVLLLSKQLFRGPNKLSITGM
jgi:hypothetical protein